MRILCSLVFLICSVVGVGVTGGRVQASDAKGGSHIVEHILQDRGPQAVRQLVGVIRLDIRMHAIC